MFKEGDIIADHYKLKKQLGQGSFGDVWLANNLLADIDVAIKFYGTLDQKGIEEFRNEFKIAYKLHHPNLLNISHFDVYNNCPYLVMPYCENGSVNQRIGQMPESEIWKFILDVSCGLSFLHNQKPPIVHQDIKPANILITSDGRYVISDFGISRSFRTQLSSTKNYINSSGTLAYMGPERFSEHPMIVLASDIWAFGMTLYEAITGNILWEGMGGCVQLNGARIPSISGTTPELERLICACLSAETWNRPTAQQIYDYAAAHIQHKQLPQLTYASKEEIKPEPQFTPQKQKNVQPVTTSLSNNRSPRSSNKQQQFLKPKHESKSSLTPLTKRILAIAAALLGVIVIGFGVTSLISSFSEEQDFVSCKTRQDFEQFIKEHPTSSHVPAARKRIEALTPATNTIKETTSAPVTTNTENQTAPVQTVREKIEIVNKPATPKPEKQQVDDRIYFQSDTKAETVPASSADNYQDDDAVFYDCQTLNDYYGYLNLFPNGRHRAQAQQAITDIKNNNHSAANKYESVDNRINRRNSPPELRRSSSHIRRTRPNGPPGGRHFRRP
jgi:serine/threonine protein kinase